jgi:hypothetical protein
VRLTDVLNSCEQKATIRKQFLLLIPPYHTVHTPKVSKNILIIVYNIEKAAIIIICCKREITKCNYHAVSLLDSNYYIIGDWCVVLHLSYIVLQTCFAIFTPYFLKNLEILNKLNPNTLILMHISNQATDTRARGEFAYATRISYMMRRLHILTTLAPLL